MEKLAIEGGTFVIASNGFADGPAEALRPFLLAQGAHSVIDISHPLVPEGPTQHRVVTHRYDGAEFVRTYDAKLRPPLSFGVDPFIPLSVPSSTAWFGFNCLATGRGLVERRVGRTQRVVHWSVDFVPERFGPGVLTRAYEQIDRFCCQRADIRVDLSGAALQARDAAYRLESRPSAPSLVVPMGCWLDRTPKTSEKNAATRHIVFLGHLVERMGIHTLLDSIELLRSQGHDITADIVGGGPLLEAVRTRANAIGNDAVTVHGFVADHNDVEEILARGTVAAAPYTDEADSFTRWADPGKLKAYLGAGLPIVMTATPPIAPQLQANGVAVIAKPNASAFATRLDEVMSNPEVWNSMHTASLAEARHYDWPAVLGDALTAMAIV